MIYKRLVSREPVNKGWSADQKYHVTDADGVEYLLRISPPEQRQRKENQFRHMERAAALHIPMCLPVEFGECREGVYSLQSWIAGADAETVVPALPAARRYAYGLDAGRILAKLHTLPAPRELPAWHLRFNQKIDRKIALYQNCPLRYEDGDAFLTFIEANRHLLDGRPQTYQHGDYHIGNMMIDRSGTLTVIDFDRDDYGDPWEEFNRIVWCAQSAPYFASGMVDGYFGGQIPITFWRLLALYISTNTLSSLPWAIPFGEGEVAVMRRQAADVLSWYDHMRSSIPAWYSRPPLNE